MLQSYDDKTTTYSPKPCPGKVDEYRFMAFYLHPSAEAGTTFHEIIDRNWLDTSSDPAAVALRNVRFHGNWVWRVLYRVTYVSRVPPHFDTNPYQTNTQAPQQAIMLADNTLLIGLVTQAMAGRKPDPATIGEAVAQVLAPATADRPYALGSQVPWWQRFVVEAHNNARGPAARLLDQIVQDTITYFQVGYASGALPG
jgi:hypothetical protein